MPPIITIPGVQPLEKCEQTHLVGSALGATIRQPTTLKTRPADGTLHHVDHDPADAHVQATTCNCFKAPDYVVMYARDDPRRACHPTGWTPAHELTGVRGYGRTSVRRNLAVWRSIPCIGFRRWAPGKTEIPVKTFCAAERWLPATCFALLILFFIFAAETGTDEGFYLVASKLVYQGKVLYRDFHYTQMPLLPYVYGVPQLIFGNSLYVGRLTSVRCYWCCRSWSWLRRQGFWQEMAA